MTAGYQESFHIWTECSSISTLQTPWWIRRKTIGSMNHIPAGTNPGHTSLKESSGFDWAVTIRNGIPAPLTQKIYMGINSILDTGYIGFFCQIKSIYPYAPAPVRLIRLQWHSILHNLLSNKSKSVSVQQSFIIWSILLFMFKEKEGQV